MIHGVKGPVLWGSQILRGLKAYGAPGVRVLECEGLVIGRWEKVVGVVYERSEECECVWCGGGEMLSDI